MAVPAVPAQAHSCALYAIVSVGLVSANTRKAAMLRWIGAGCSILAAVLLAPLVPLFLLPASYLDHRSVHPRPSTWTPPSYRLPVEDIAAYDRDGVLILRNVLPKELAEKLDIAGHDLVNSATMHCELSKFTGPPIFHGYQRYCGRAQLVHDFLRDVLYLSPLAHIAAQLLKDDGEVLRNIADVFMSGGQLPKRWHSDFLAFSKFSSARDIPCDDGLIIWMPLEESFAEKNGMLYVNGSHRRFKNHFTQRAWGAQSAYGVKAFFEYVSAAPKEPLVSPRMQLGDAAIFSQCTLHTTSGIHKGGIRRAYQLRFAKNVVFEEGSAGSGGSVSFPGVPQHPEARIESPQIWPQTLELEDRIRARGHVTYPATTWMAQLASKPLFVAATTMISLKVALLGDTGEA